MTHLTMEQLLELREPGLEPGDGAAQAHLDQCARCRAEADRLAQRIARLRALPSPRVSRPQFQQVRVRYLAQRRGRRVRLGLAGALALAASLALAVVLRNAAGPGTPAEVMAAETELEAVMIRSRELEAALQAFDPDSRVLDGRTAGIAFRLEDQVGAVDRQLEMLNLMPPDRASLSQERLQLWRERVGLLDALMDVHLTRAKYAGM